MAKITFILGGARSGKSTFALELAKKYRQVAFIATCQGLDKEMQQRIKAHQSSRPGHWQTFEEPKEIMRALGKIRNNFPCIIIDCLTLLVSNLVLSGASHDSIENNIKKVLQQLKKFKGRVIIVSNEVGLGIVPRNKLGRNFRDIAGRVNQFMAVNSDEVFFLISGIPTKIKGRKNG
ncbi:MAG: bifunctional adenosylcobinamide kinase/adenosylcobinamide-phosphate guanylyltransferase [Candidatus Omnitrophica bacterium]|nr:bifunctional adenosylcobinamide kinase/adenosylcobinamide-phosphate guanylyltransferase [Candidatus Omnitrophota bacterium]